MGKGGKGTKKEKKINKFLCPVCSTSVSNEDKGIQCDGECDFWYHCGCAGLSNSTYENLGEEDAWICQTCTSSDMPLVKRNTNGVTPKTSRKSRMTVESLVEPISLGESANLRVLKVDQLNPTMQTMGASINSLINAIVELQQAVVYQSKKYDEFYIDMKTIKEDNARISKDISSVKQINNKLVLDNEQLCSRVNSLEQAMIANKLEISGIPFFPQENLLNILKTMCNQINCTLDESHVISIYRKAVNKSMATASKSNHSTVVVTLQTGNVRQKIMDAKRMKGTITTKDLGYLAEEKVFINEALTQANKHLFWMARQAKLIGYKYCWVKNGSIFLKKSDGDQPRKISKESDIPTSPANQTSPGMKNDTQPTA